jgi:hypothetical protein
MVRVAAGYIRVALLKTVGKTFILSAHQVFSVVTPCYDIDCENSGRLPPQIRYLMALTI